MSVLSPLGHGPRGSWIAFCHRCGRKFLGNTLRRDDYGFLVCDQDFDPKHPGDIPPRLRSPDPELPPSNLIGPDPTVDTTIDTLDQNFQNLYPN